MSGMSSVTGPDSDSAGVVSATSSKPYSDKWGRAERLPLAEGRREGLGDEAQQKPNFGYRSRKCIAEPPRKLNVRIENNQRTIEVRIPPGARDGSKIRIPGGGPEGGDLYIRLQMEAHSTFSVDGDHTETELLISPWEAALGTTVEVPTLDGASEIKLPPGVSSGQRVRLRNQGLNLRDGGRGNHYIKLKIVVPTDLSDDERRHFEELARSSKFNPRA